MVTTAHDRFIRGFVLLLALTLAGMIWINRDRFTPIGPGAKTPDYKVFDLAGDTVSLASAYRGKVVVLNVWATWCEPCVREMPTLQALHEQLAQEGVEVLGVSVDVGDNVRVIEFAQGLHLTFPILRDPSGDIQKAFAIGGLPTTFIIGRDGRIRQRQLGEKKWDDPVVIAELRGMLKD